MYCKHCGNKLDGDMKFCSYCGTEVTFIEDDKIEVKSTPYKTNKTEREKNPISWLIAGMGLMLLFVLVNGGCIYVLRNPQDKNKVDSVARESSELTSEKDIGSTKSKIDDVTLLMGTANWMTKDASVLANRNYLAMLGAPPEIFASVEPFSKIASNGLVPVRAYYCDDMKQMLRNFTKEMELDDSDEMETLLFGDLADYAEMNLPTLLAGTVVGSSYLLGMSTSSYNRLLHAKVNISGVQSIILQYSSDVGDVSYENGLYSWTVFLPMKDEKVLVTTYHVTPMFNMEWGQELIRNWTVYESNQIEDAIQLVKDIDYDAPPSKIDMDSQDYRKIAEDTADILRTTDFTEAANLYVGNGNYETIELIKRYQSNMRETEPQYEIYEGKGVQALIDERVREISDEIKEELEEMDEDDKNELLDMLDKEYIAILPERYRSLWGSQVFNGSIAQYGTTVLAVDSIMRSCAFVAFKDKIESFPKPKNWDSPKVVIMKYNDMATALFFNESENNYISISIFFISDRNGFDESLKEAGFQKVN